MQITSEGLRLQPMVCTLLREAEEVERPPASDELTGVVNVGVGEIGVSVVPALAAGFRKLHPRVEVRITCGQTFEITSLLSRLVIDCMITSSLTRAPGAYLTEIYRDRSVIITHPKHPLAAAAKPSFGDLADAEWVMPMRTTLSNQRMMEALRGHIANFKLAIEINSDAAIVEAVRAGGGVACLPFEVVENEVAAGSLAVIPVVGFEAWRPTFLVRLEHVQRSAAARAFDKYVLGVFEAKEKRS